MKAKSVPWPVAACLGILFIAGCFSGVTQPPVNTPGASAQQTPAASTRKWDYDVRCVPTNAPAPPLEALKSLGEGGWELLAISTEPVKGRSEIGRCYYFKKAY